MSSLKETEEDVGRESERQSPAFIRRLTYGFSNALGLVLHVVAMYYYQSSFIIIF